MADRTNFRLNDIIDAIDQIDALLQGRSYRDLTADKVVKAAFERFLEILSEASRHIPESLKATRPDIPWRRVSDIGNHLRHAYDRVDSQILGSLFQWRLDGSAGGCCRLSKEKQLNMMGIWFRVMFLGLLAFGLAGCNLETKTPLFAGADAKLLLADYPNLAPYERDGGAWKKSTDPLSIQAGSLPLSGQIRQLRHGDFLCSA